MSFCQFRTERESCSVDICNKPVLTRGYCRSHYRRLLRHGDPLGGAPERDGAPMRFINEVALQHASDECLTWPFGKNGGGYGVVWIDGKHVVASRYVCELANGAPPTPDHEAAHSCGKGKDGCIAPSHLSWKTRTENESDKLIHGTYARGERHSVTKLTEAAVREILDLRGVETQHKLADRFGVSRTAISNIYVGRTWAWLSEEAAS